MNPDWIMGLVGGAIIGLAGAIYLLGNGRIMGACGIIGGLVDGSAGDQALERLAFLAALVAVPAVLTLLMRPDVDHASDRQLDRHHRGRIAGRRRHADRERMHLRARGLRHLAAVAAWHRRHRRLHRRRRVILSSPATFWE